MKRGLFVLFLLIAFSGIASAIDISIDSVSSGKNYLVSTLSEGDRPYIDRSYRAISLGDYEDFDVIRTSNSDKVFSSDDILFTFSISEPARVSVALDSRVLLPENSATGDGFLTSEGFVATNDLVTVSGVSYIIYQREFDAGIVSIRGQGSSYSRTSNYFVFVEDLDGEDPVDPIDPEPGETNFCEDIFADGVLFYTSFDDGSASDVSSNGNNGEVNGASPIRGIKSGGLDFDGANDNVDILSTSSSLANEFSISLWFKADSIDNSDQRTLISKWGSRNDRARAFRLEIERNNQLRFFIADLANGCRYHTGGAVMSSIPGGIREGEWYHVGLVFRSEDSIEMYVNGVLSSRRDHDDEFCRVSNADITIGSKTDDTQYFDGIIDEVAVWNRALSSTELNELSSCENSSPTPRPPPSQEKPEIYVISYVGDIDGAVSEAWFKEFYQEIADFYEDNNIPVGFSFYPGTMDSGDDFRDAFLTMYNSPDIELIQKGFTGNGAEEILDSLSVGQQRSIIRVGQNAFLDSMEDYGVSNAKLPTTYNQIFGRFNEKTLEASSDLGFNFYFDFFLGDGLDYIDSTSDYDVIQYGVSVTESGTPGPEEDFKSASEIVNEVKSFTTEGSAPIMKIDGVTIVPLFVHQQDFEDERRVDNINRNKWNTYTSAILQLASDPDIKMIRPDEVFALKRSTPPIPRPNPGPIGESICQFASSASANIAHAQAPASNAVGAPDASNVGQCSVWSGYGDTWSVPNWDVVGELELSFDKPVIADSVKVFGDYDSCWESIVLKDSRSGSEKKVYDGIEESCNFDLDITGNFVADTVIVKTCGWSWSYVDAVELCGTTA